MKTVRTRMGQRFVTKPTISTSTFFAKFLNTPNPFAETEKELASCGYRCRQFDLTGVGLIVRTEVDAAVKTVHGTDYVTVRALNECDSTLPWKKSLDTQCGAVVATEMRKNSAKLACWTVQAILAGTEQLRIGYITRYHSKDDSRHVILGTQAHKPRDFAAQMNLSLANG
jgi:translation initiation factor 3 subunit D